MDLDPIVKLEFQLSRELNLGAVADLRKIENFKREQQELERANSTLIKLSREEYSTRKQAAFLKGVEDARKAREAVLALNRAMFGGVTGLGTDEDLIVESLSGISSEQGLYIQELYQRLFQRDLKQDLLSELSGDYLKQAFDALVGKSIKLPTRGGVNGSNKHVSVSGNIFEEAIADYDKANSAYNRIKSLVSMVGGNLAQDLLDQFYLKQVREILEKDYQLLNYSKDLTSRNHFISGLTEVQHRIYLESLAVNISNSANNLRAEQEQISETTLSAVNTVAVVGVSLATAGTATPFMLGIYAGATSILTSSAGKSILLGDDYTFKRFVEEDLITGAVDGVFSGVGNVIGIRQVINPLAKKVIAKNLERNATKVISKEALEMHGMRVARKYASGKFSITLAENLTQALASELPAGIVNSAIFGVRMYHQGEDINKILDVCTKMIGLRLVFGCATAGGFSALPFGARIATKSITAAKTNIMQAATKLSVAINEEVMFLQMRTEKFISRIFLPPQKSPFAFAMATTGVEITGLEAQPNIFLPKPAYGKKPGDEIFAMVAGDTSSIKTVSADDTVNIRLDDSTHIDKPIYPQVVDLPNGKKATIYEPLITEEQVQNSEVAFGTGQRFKDGDSTREALLGQAENVEPRLRSIQKKINTAGRSNDLEIVSAVEDFSIESKILFAGNASESHKMKEVIKLLEELEDKIDSLLKPRELELPEEPFLPQASKSREAKSKLLYEGALDMSYYPNIAESVASLTPRGTLETPSMILEVGGGKTPRPYPEEILSERKIVVGNIDKAAADWGDRRILADINLLQGGLNDPRLQPFLADVQLGTVILSHSAKFLDPKKFAAIVESALQRMPVGGRIIVVDLRVVEQLIEAVEQAVSMKAVGKMFNLSGIKSSFLQRSVASETERGDMAIQMQIFRNALNCFKYLHNKAQLDPYSYKVKNGVLRPRLAIPKNVSPAEVEEFIKRTGVVFEEHEFNVPPKNARDHDGEYEGIMILEKQDPTATREKLEAERKKANKKEREEEKKKKEKRKRGRH